LSGTWPTARAAIVAQLSAATAQVTGLQAETLSAYEWAPAGKQPADKFPYCFVTPAEQQVNRYPGQMRETVIDVRVRFFLSGRGEDSMENLQKRYDAWVEALKDAWDDTAALDGAADISVEQQFGGLALFEDIDTGWGFDMTLGNVRITETKTFSA
jgi:hypothetical protein